MLRRTAFLAFFLSLPPPEPERDGFAPPRDGLRQLLLFLVSLIFVPTTVYASDDITLGYGAGEDINVCGVCKYVYNGYSGAPSEYIPDNSCSEWSSFYNGGALWNQGISPCPPPPSPPPCCYSPPPCCSDGGGSDGGGSDGGDG